MVKARKVKQLIVVTKDQAGMLAKLSELIATQNVNIDDICAYGMEGKAYFMIVTNENEGVKNVLKKQGWEIKEEEVISVELENRPGALRDMSMQLKNKNINIKYCYGTTYEGSGPCHFIFKAEDNNQALLALK
jgi:hypothetical protein